MKLLKQTITNFLDTNLKQPYPEWTSSTSYAQFEWVNYKNFNYMSVVNGNAGVEPDLNTGKWLLMEVDNSYAAIDLHSHTASVGDATTLKNKTDTFMHFKLPASGATALVLGEVLGGKLTVAQFKGTTQVKTKTYDIENVRHVKAWWDYYYQPLQHSTIITKSRDFVIDDLAPTIDSIEVTITFGVDGKASLSSMVLGKPKSLGETQYGVSDEILDYSEKIIDENTGIVSIDKRDNEEVMNITLKINAVDTQPAKRLIKEVLGTVSMFIVDESEKSKYENLIIMGYPEKFSVTISNQVFSWGHLKIREMI